MSGNALPCLGSFKMHSCYPWCWLNDKNLYYRDCSLMGCSFFETSKKLVPIGQTNFVGQLDSHTHNWTVWQSADTPDGLYIPPWLYKRECGTCKVKQMAENLKKPSRNRSRPGKK